MLVGGFFYKRLTTPRLGNDVKQLKLLHTGSGVKKTNEVTALENSLASFLRKL